MISFLKAKSLHANIYSSFVRHPNHFEYFYSQTIKNIQNQRRRPWEGAIFFVIIFLEFPVRTYLRRERYVPVQHRTLNKNKGRIKALNKNNPGPPPTPPGGGV